MKTNSITQLLEQYKVVIPPIQRDYAHGRERGKVPRIRDRFLNAIVEVLSKPSIDIPLELDFIYGYTYQEKTGNQLEISFFKPLDGQQRLTTLFLIHWFVAVRENKITEAKVLLTNFSYATRHSSQLFCNKLIDFTPVQSDETVDLQIINQSWFFSAWLSDPTILSMLVVLKDIEAKFSNLNDVWSKLTGDNPRVIFHLLAMDDLGLPDDLYIKMNARGKELTDFEHFKSQFSEFLTPDKSKIFNQKIDKEWSDLFWNIFKEKESKDIAKEVDSGFLSFFWFITDMIISKNSILIDNDYWLNIVKKVYSNRDHVDYLFRCIDFFEDKEKNSPEYFENLFYIDNDDFEVDRTRIFFNDPKVNLFHKCAELYGYEGKKNSFSVGEQLLLYAIIYSELNGKKDLEKSIRKLRNLFYASEDQLRKEYLSIFLYSDIEKIIDLGELSENSKLSKRQLKEEGDKLDAIQENPNLIECIYKLEDHNLLRGSIAVFDIDDSLLDLAPLFHKIYDSDIDYLQTSKALLTIGDYSQGYGKGELRRFGNKSSSTWRQLLTQSTFRKNFNNIKSILKTYLSYFKNDPSFKNDDLIDIYLSEFMNDPKKSKTWIYYYVKYSSFILWNQNQTNGFYYWENFNDRPYEGTMMFRTQFNGRHWSPFLLEINSHNEKCTLENYGNYLQFTNGNIILLIKNINNGFQFIANDEDSNYYLKNLLASSKLDSKSTLVIPQDKDGIDLKDRIKECTDFLSELID